MSVIDFPGETRLDLSVERVLDAAKECETVFVLGWDQDGELYVASSTGDVAELMLLYEKWKHSFLAGHYDQ